MGQRKMGCKETVKLDVSWNSFLGFGNIYDKKFEVT